MQEPHVKGVANHHGPESCVDVREDGREALTGGSAGQLTSSENDPPGRRPCCIKGKATWTAAPRRESPPPGPAESKNLCMRGHPMHENREIPVAAVAAQTTDRSGKARGRKPDRHAAGKSDIGVIPMITLNKAGPSKVGGGDGGGKADDQGEP